MGGCPRCAHPEPPQSARIRGTFLRLMSHELRTPLTSIRGYSELLVTGRAGPLSDQQQRMVTMIDLSAVRLHGVVEDLIVVASLDAGDFRLRLEPTRLAAVVARAADEVATTARDAGVTISPDVAADLVVAADPRHLQRALSNLLTAAVASCPGGGTVAVTATGAAPVAVVIGSGPGGRLDQLLARFLGAGPVDPADLDGAGVGLAVARAVVEHHGGRLEVTSDAGAGTRIAVTLPAADVPSRRHQ
ncbi:sensor histidine kinase [Dactylosporangium cerinum]